MKRSFIFILIAIFLISVFSLESFPQKRKTPVRKRVAAPIEKFKIGTVITAVSPERERRIDTFQKVWQTIKDNYFDQTFGGQNWDKIKIEFESRVRQSESDWQLHLILQEMINRLNKSHFMIIPPEVYKEIENATTEIAEKIDEAEDKEDEEIAAAETENKKEIKPERTTHFGIGVDIRFINNQIVVTNIEKDSPAAKAGLKTGYIIEKINGVSLKSFLETFGKNNAYAKVYEKQMALVLLSLINSKTDDGIVGIGFLDENDQPKELKIKRELQKGELAKVIPGLPEMLVTFDAESFTDEIGYIKFNSFVLPNVEKFCGAISRFKNTKALVIDMRGNIGGNFGALFGIAGLLTDKPFVIGSEVYKYGKQIRLITPQLKNFKGKIVVLTDAQSYSAAEVFASGLKENNRATIIGDKTSGSALPAITTVLPTGAVFLYAIANFETPKGNLLEGTGVEPNIKIALDRRTLLQGKDAQLEAAVSFLKEEIKIKDKGNLATVEVNLPPPAPKSNSKDKILAVSPPAIAPKKLPDNIQDPKALKIIEDYIEAVGGRDAWGKLSSIAAKGKSEIRQSGAVVEGKVEIFRKAPNKAAKIIKFEGIGEINEVFDGANYFVQSDFMGTQKTEYMNGEINLASNFKELLEAKQNYPSIAYENKFDREGKKVHLIKAVAKDGATVYFAFDVETKFLVGRAGTLTETSFDDYRRVGDWLFPFTISESIMTYKLTEVKPNAPVDDQLFAPKESCFSKID